MSAQAERELIYRLPPYTKSYITGTSVRSFHLETNSLGLRDSEHDFEKSSAVFRIMLLGDSIGMGEGVGLRDTFIKQLDKLANERRQNRHIETINAAIRGYGNDQEFVLFERIGPKFHPGLVILAFFEANDFIDNRHGDIFKLDGDKLIKTLPGKENSLKFRYYSIQIKIQNLPGYRSLLGHSHLANFARARIGSYLFRWSFLREVDGPIGSKDLTLTTKI